ncbi:SAM-dependent methyltransferase, partial [Casaltella massiliensis]|nr:SAM-dependent methyltransferase [Casaltella massiliensis]
KMSKNIYDYYPNKVMKIKIFKDHNYYKIEKLSKQIISDSYEINEILKEKDLKSDIINQKKENISKLQREIDYLIESSLGVKSPI